MADHLGIEKLCMGHYGSLVELASALAYREQRRAVDRVAKCLPMREN